LQSKAIAFLSRDEVLEIHRLLLDRFGGKSGVRDLGLLESALFRPKTGYYNGISELSAALFESLIMNHPFIDGNKRVAFFATDVFLRLNGYKFQVKPEEAYSFLMGLLGSNDCTYENLLPWVRKSIKKLA
jgi:death-on-curing protein